MRACAIKLECRKIEYDTEDVVAFLRIKEKKTVISAGYYFFFHSNISFRWFFHLTTAPRRSITFLLFIVVSYTR